MVLMDLYIDARVRPSSDLFGQKTETPQPADVKQVIGQCVAGLKRDEPWHLYANPLKPSICPILALSRYILSNKEILHTSTGGKLFPVGKQYSRYTKFMKRFF